MLFTKKCYLKLKIKNNDLYLKNILYVCNTFLNKSIIV